MQNYQDALLPKCLLPKRPITEMSNYRNVQIAKCPVTEMSITKTSVTKVSVTEMSGYHRIEQLSNVINVKKSTKKTFLTWTCIVVPLDLVQTAHD